VTAFARSATVVAVAIAGLAWAFNAGAEDAYENMTGRVAVQSRASSQSQTSSSMALAYGENPTLQFPPQITVRPGSTEATGQNAFCVRTCDGRYFPASSQDKQSTAEGCKNLCPASETKIFTGNSIDGASSKDGKPYSSLPNAFRYRKELVAGCTCNGKDVIGLASVNIEDDKTLRRGDLFANKGGFEVVNRVENGQPRFSAAGNTVRSQFAKLPVIASQ
jgi:Protein of unknown function (DUF2865)